MPQSRVRAALPWVYLTVGGLMTVGYFRLSSESDAKGSEVSIEDDGVGFAVQGDGLVRRGHFGIAGMRQRIEMVGGTLEIASSPGRGRTVWARAPRTPLPKERHLPADPGRPLSTPRERREPEHDRLGARR